MFARWVVLVWLVVCGLVVSVGCVVVGGVSGVSAGFVEVGGLSAPRWVRASHVGVGRVVVSWLDRLNVGRGVEGYLVLRNGVVVGEFGVDDLVIVDGLFTVEIDGLSQGGSWFQVVAVGGSGVESRRSDWDYLYVDNTRPPAPLDVRVDDYDSVSGCAVLSFVYLNDVYPSYRHPRGEARGVSWELVDHRGVVWELGEVSDRFPPDVFSSARTRKEFCVPVDGGVYYLQLTTLLASEEFGVSVKSSPVRFRALRRDVTAGFGVSRADDGVYTASWGEPAGGAGVARFVVLDRLEPVAVVGAAERSVEFEVDESRGHWFQLVTEDVWANRSRRSAPVFMEPVVVGDGGSIGDVVWGDANGDGVRGGGEAGVGGVRLSLVAAGSGDVVGSVVSGVDGSWVFDGLDRAGCYVVVMEPSQWVPTVAGVGGNRWLDSDLGADGRSGEVCFDGGGERFDVDVGVVPAGFSAAPVVTVNAHLFWDANGNGVRDAGETGVRGGFVTVQTTEGDPNLPPNFRDVRSIDINEGDDGRVSLTFEFLGYELGARCNYLYFSWEPVNGSPFDDYAVVSSVSAPFSLDPGTDRASSGVLCIGDAGPQIGPPGPKVGADPYVIDVEVAYVGRDFEPPTGTA